MAHTPDELLAHAEWLRRLAVSLVGPGAADDVVQDTYVAALRHPPPRGRVRQWLGRVATNLARMRFRRDAVRAKHAPAVEQLYDGEEISHERLYDRFETQRTLVRIVSELAEPYRSTILLRYFEGLNAREIARLHGVAAGTVRWRLKEGLDKVRADLDREHGSRRKWQLLLYPLVPRGRDAGTGTWLAGAAIVTVAAVAVTWSVWPRAPAPDRPVAPAVAWAPEGPSKPPPTAPAATGASERNEQPPAADSVAESGSLAGRVIDWATGKGVPAAQVTFSAPEGTLSIATAPDGRFRFLPPRPGGYDLQVVTAPGYLPFAPSLGHSPIAFVARAGRTVDNVLIYLTPAVDYDGVVLSPEGKPVAGARVVLLGATEGEQTLQPLIADFTTDAKGRFSFNARDDALFEARHPRFAPGRARVDSRVQISHRLEIRLAPLDRRDASLGRQRIAGRVIDESGSPVGDVLVTATAVDWNDLHPAAQSETDTDGVFRFAGLDPGAHEVVARAPGRAPVRIPDVPAGTENLLITLRAGGSIDGRVLDAQTGKPIAAFSVTVLRPDGPLREVTIADATFMDADGHFALPGLELGPARVLARAAGYAPCAPVSVSVGESVELRLGRGGTLTGKVTDRSTGAPLPYARITTEGGRGEGTSAAPAAQSTVTDDDGSFTLSGIAPGLRSLIIAAYQHHGRILAGLVFGEGATVGPITIDLAPTAPGEEPTIEMVGIGASLSAKDDALVVVTIFPGGGASEVAMIPGDAILAVDGTAVTALGFADSIQRIRGPEGTVVRLTVRRGAATLDLTVPRRRVRA